jgi:hypothetical protein
MSTYFDECEVCKHPVKSWMNDNDYESRSYNRRTLIPYQERSIETPERSFSVTICQTCLDKDPTLKELMQKKRLEWYDSKINQCDCATTKIKAEIIKIKADVNQLAKDKLTYIILRTEVAKGKAIDSANIPRSKLH